MRAFRIIVSEADEELATALLWEAGTAGIEVGVADPGQVLLLAYFADDVDLDTLREQVPGVTVEPVAVPDLDWVARYRESFRSFPVGGFIVAPPWDRPVAAEHLLLVDPGRAFGTGTHESTRLCLGAIEELFGERPFSRVIDVGTGTGILAVAATRLGAWFVVASDNDPEATASARAHAQLNGIGLQVVRGDGPYPFVPASFDLVLANLTTPLLVAHAQGLAALCGPKGAVVLSGLLATDLGEVESAFSVLGKPRVRRDGEWAALVYEDRSNSQREEERGTI
jgi:ribosomal protein L11 methyltransferase